MRPYRVGVCIFDDFDATGPFFRKPFPKIDFPKMLTTVIDNEPTEVLRPTQYRCDVCWTAQGYFVALWEFRRRVW